MAAGRIYRAAVNASGARAETGRWGRWCSHFGNLLSIPRIYLTRAGNSREEGWGQWREQVRASFNHHSVSFIHFPVDKAHLPRLLQTRGFQTPENAKASGNDLPANSSSMAR